MLSLDEIRDRLADRRLVLVAKLTGLSYGTLRNLRNPEYSNPTLRTIKLLSDYLTKAA